MAETEQLNVVLTLKDELSGKMTGIHSSLSRMGTLGNQMNSTFKGIGARFGTEFGLIQKAAKIGLVSVMAMGAGLAAFGVSSLKAFASAEASQTRFEHAMKAIAKASDAEVSALRRQQDALSLTTRFEDDAIASGQGFLATFQLNGKQIELMTPRLLDMAEGLRDSTGQTVGLEGASNMLGKALQLGTVGMLAKAGVTIPGTTKAMQELFKAKFAVANIEERTVMLSELVDGNFKGQAVTAGTTLAGQMDILAHSYENVKESIGAALAQAVYPFVQAIQSFVTGDQMKGYVETMTRAVKDWIESIGGAEGIKARLMEFKDKLINEILPAVWKLIQVVGEVITFIWEHRRAIMYAIIVWEAFKIAISAWEVYKLVSGAISTITSVLGSGGLSGMLGSLSAVALPLLVVAMAAVTAYIIYKAIVAFKDLQSQIEQNRLWVDNNSKSLEILQQKVGSLSTEKANEQFQNAINKSKDADKALLELSDRYSGLGGVVMAVADQFYDWGKTVSDAIRKVWGAWNEKPKSFGGGGGGSWGEGGSSFKGTLTKSEGGVVYAASGFFQSKGTDVIPAMLTPGEMVLNSGQQANLFRQLNSGSGRSISINISGDNYFNSEADMNTLINKIQDVLSREQEKASWGLA